MNETKEAKNSDGQESDTGDNGNEQADTFFTLPEMKATHPILLSDDSSVEKCYCNPVLPRIAMTTTSGNCLYI